MDIVAVVVLFLTHIEWSHGNVYSFLYVQITDRNFNTDLEDDRLEAVKLSKEQEIKLGIENYETLFDFIYSPSCKEAGDDLYIKWECSPNKKILRAHIKQNIMCSY